MPIAAVSRTANHIDLCAVGLDGAVYSTWVDKHEHEWYRLGRNTFPQNTSIAAISRKPNSIDLFAVGADGGVYTAWWNEGWQDWSQLGEARFAEHTHYRACPHGRPHRSVRRRPRSRHLLRLVGWRMA